MKKINCIICDGCRIVCTIVNVYTIVPGKKKELHYCNHCMQKKYDEWLILREKSKNEYNEKLCYCGHTNKCECLDPDFNLFKDSVARRTIIMGSPNNGWKKYV